MNSKLELPILLWLILAAVPCAVAQTTSISQAEFDKITSAAFAKASTRHRRETTNVKKFHAGKVVEEELTTQDFAPPDKEKWLILARSAAKNTRIEIVYIGDVEYRREDKNPWKKMDRADPANQMTIGPDASPGKARATVAYTREDKTIEGMRLQILFEKSNMAYGSPGLRTRSLTLDAYGYILKVEESVSEGAAENVVFTSLLSIVYSSHPIIIEAPIK